MEKSISTKTDKRKQYMRPAYQVYELNRRVCSFLIYSAEGNREQLVKEEQYYTNIWEDEE